MTDTLPPTLTPFEAGISVALMVICLGCFIALKGSLNPRKNNFKLNVLLLAIVTNGFTLAKPWIADTFGMGTYRFVSGVVTAVAVIGFMLIIFHFAGFATGTNDGDCLTGCDNRHACMADGGCAHTAKDSATNKGAVSQSDKDAGV